VSSRAARPYQGRVDAGPKGKLGKQDSDLHRPGPKPGGLPDYPIPHSAPPAERARHATCCQVRCLRIKLIVPLFTLYCRANAVVVSCEARITGMSAAVSLAWPFISPT
jgi:hypothetical protein